MDLSYEIDVDNSDHSAPLKLKISDTRLIYKLPEMLNETLDNRIVGEDSYRGKKIRSVVIVIFEQVYSEYEAWMLVFAADRNARNSALSYLERIRDLCMPCSDLPWVGGDEKVGEACLYALYCSESRMQITRDIVIDQGTPFDYERYLKIFSLFYKNREALLYIRWDEISEFVLGYWSDKLHASIVNEYSDVLANYLFRYMECDTFDSEKVRKYFKPLGIYKHLIEYIAKVGMVINGTAIKVVNACVYGADHEKLSFVLGEIAKKGIEITPASSIYDVEIKEAEVETEKLLKYRDNYGDNHFPICNTGYHSFDKASLSWR